MKPAAFKQANGTLLGAPGANFGTAENVSDLPVCRTPNDGIISCWQLTWLDRLRLIVTGKVWLLVLSRSTHPPVAVTVESPFA